METPGRQESRNCPQVLFQTRPSFADSQSSRSHFWAWFPVFKREQSRPPVSRLISTVHGSACAWRNCPRICDTCWTFVPRVYIPQPVLSPEICYLWASGRVICTSPNPYDRRPERRGDFLVITYILLQTFYLLSYLSWQSFWLILSIVFMIALNVGRVPKHLVKFSLTGAGDTFLEPCICIWMLGSHRLKAIAKRGSIFGTDAIRCWFEDDI
jgi:hypothetical protein